MYNHTDRTSLAIGYAQIYVTFQSIIIPHNHSFWMPACTVCGHNVLNVRIAKAEMRRPLVDEDSFHCTFMACVCGHVQRETYTTNDAHKKFIHDVLIIRYNILWKRCRLTALLLSSARPMHIQSMKIVVSVNSNQLDQLLNSTIAISKSIMQLNLAIH